VDIGQKADPSAIVVVETEERPRPDDPKRTEVHFLVRHLERLPLGTPYPEVVDRIEAIALGAKERKGGRSPFAFVDATGVGTPVVDMIRDRRGLWDVWACYFNHGDRRSEDGRDVRIGKAYLVSRLQALLQTRRIHLPKTREAQALARELLDYEIRVSEDANERYGAFKVGSHDDLVTALGLAVQKDPVPLFIGIG